MKKILQYQGSLHKKPETHYGQQIFFIENAFQTGPGLPGPDGLLLKCTQMKNVPERSLSEPVTCWKTREISVKNPVDNTRVFTGLSSGHF